MGNISVLPKPILDAQEMDKIDILTEDYEKFMEPGFIAEAMEVARESIDNVMPQLVKDYIQKLSTVVSEADLIRQALEVVAQGFVEVEKLAAKLTINKEVIVKRLNKENPLIQSYEDICFARGYEIEKALNLKDLEDMTLAALQGGATGYFGFVGIPANIVLSLFLYFRAVQKIALHYGYDVQNNPGELQIASVITMQALNPNMESGSETLSSFIGKMMMMTKLTALRQGLNKPYAEMINKGGIQLLFVQIRSLANAAAKNALKKAGEKPLEKTMFTEMLEQLGKQISKDSAKKAIPYVGAVIGLLFDSHYMSKVLRYAKIVYHKRFLLEKEQRIIALVNVEDSNIVLMWFKKLWRFISSVFKTSSDNEDITN